MTAVTSIRDKNQLLAALPSAEWQQLQPDLEWVELAQGTVLHQTGAALRHVLFPTTATVSLVSSMEDGASAEVAVVGSEGMVGVCAFMGHPHALSDAVVQHPGHGYRMSTQAIVRHTQRSPAVMHQLLGYTQALFTHMAQSSACNRHHSLDQQLCRWLLHHLDRQSGPDMLVTQERIAGLLGVRREGVTHCALKLQKAGLIHYSRGHIAILDRDGLEARSCECYAVVRHAYDHLSNEPAAPHLHLCRDNRQSAPVVTRQLRAA
ncbi:MAG: Crp/Fnr family transcriptional regulator [Burkholderiales bacterium RIFCSPLOWO2_12_67_14]|nr:MAG: Crp/Fnr family transcriptional regulator [Burkholderiales bacterium RIFCSPLOWO2_02_FULL_67_64]OGB36629.1 MAG: Crp/Fnr family transcriptional regulator [Burkholderiales bacterium RIFCSPHIGHO2_12_FULL_67_38]OGB47859.1 MAG: Crp/Fnr family transcriptional regulator [Burkholderiales bacterium RIFCSPLOWO2_12_67_14]